MNHLLYRDILRPWDCYDEEYFDRIRHLAGKLKVALERIEHFGTIEAEGHQGLATNAEQAQCRADGKQITISDLCDLTWRTGCCWSITSALCSTLGAAHIECRLVHFSRLASSRERNFQLLPVDLFGPDGIAYQQSRRMGKVRFKVGQWTMQYACGMDSSIEAGLMRQTYTTLRILRNPASIQ